MLAGSLEPAPVHDAHLEGAGRLLGIVPDELGRLPGQDPPKAFHGTGTGGSGSLSWAGSMS